MNVDKLQFIDLGLPSGKLWATENVKNENGDEDHFLFDKAVDFLGKNFPSYEDWQELFNLSTYTWDNERKGCDIVGPNGNSIFLPAAGYRNGVIECGVGSYGGYWSSSFYDGDIAYGIYFRSDSLYPQGISNRYNGLSVRLVR